MPSLKKNRVSEVITRLKTIRIAENRSSFQPCQDLPLKRPMPPLESDPTKEAAFQTGEHPSHEVPSDEYRRRL